VPTAVIREIAGAGAARLLDEIVQRRLAGFVVYDLEMTAWEGSLARDWSGPDEFPEIVQIGAVRIDTVPAWRETAAFDVLLRPRFYPTLSSYFTGLTGIDQARVDADGIPFADALQRFNVFAKGVPALAFGRDGETLARNCHRYGLPPLSVPVLDIRAELCRRSGIPLMMSSELPAALGFAAAGRSHEGLSDARAVANAIRRLTG
jgi:inhibitor of KinA sporulation pathway (predicted exonuclease)